MADFTAGDVVIKTIELINHKGEKFDLYGMWNMIEIFEDMFDAAITANVSITDGINLFERFPIIGQEKIIIKYLTPTMEAVKVELVTFDIPRRESVNDAVFTYTLQFMTEDGLKARTSYMMTPLSGDPVEAIKTVLNKSLNSTRKVSADQLANTISYIPARQRPFETINTICNRSFTAISADSPDVMFFDTVDGYQVRSLYGLMQQEPHAKYYKIEDAAVFQREPTTERALYKVGNFTLTQANSILAKVSGGSYGGTLGVFDIKTRKYTEKVYGVETSPENFSILNGNSGVKVDSEIIKSAPSSNFRYVLKGTKDHSLLERTARLDQVFSGIRVVADLPGNSSLRSGQVLHVELPSPDPKEMGRADKFMSGKYLIASLRHVIVASGINNHRTVVELVKDSVKLKV